MTRINANIDPVDLCDQHLLAEYREILRIPNFILGGCMTLQGKNYYGMKKLPKIDIDNIPESYKLGPGHVKFFYNKVRFLHYRFLKIKLVLNSRNIKNIIDDTSFVKLEQQFPHLYNDIDLDYANSIVCDRIIERISSMTRVTMNKESLDKNDYSIKFKKKYGN
jgi:deoxyribonuclease (pyrimidine dimer)